MADTKDRMQRLRAKRIAQGERPVELWLDPDSHQRLLRLSDLTGGTFKQVIQRALVTLEAQGNAPAPLTPRDALSDALRDTSERDAHPLQRKATLVARVRELKTQGLSLQAIANRLNNEGVPTISGKGTWQKGTISTLLAQAEGTR